jgi:hypothetical protein
VLHRVIPRSPTPGTPSARYEAARLGRDPRGRTSAAGNRAPKPRYEAPERCSGRGGARRVDAALANTRASRSRTRTAASATYRLRAWVRSRLAGATRHHARSHHRALGGTVRRTCLRRWRCRVRAGVNSRITLGSWLTSWSGVRHGAADRVALEKAGLRLIFETFEDFGEDPHRHYVCVAADDASEARASIIAALGWDEVALADVVTRPAPRPCEAYSTAQQFV